MIPLPNEWVNPTEKLGEDATDLIGVDSNAGTIMGFTSRALKKAGNPTSVVDGYRMEAMSGDYDHLLQTSLTYLGYAGYLQ